MNSFEQQNGQVNLKVLGSGCKKCKQLAEAAEKALAELGLAKTIEHVTDFGEIAAYGVLITPALVVNGKVVSSGQVLQAAEIVQILQKN